jgi:hypothetical protein
MGRRFSGQGGSSEVSFSFRPQGQVGHSDHVAKCNQLASYPHWNIVGRAWVGCWHGGWGVGAPTLPLFPIRANINKLCVAAAHRPSTPTTTLNVNPPRPSSPINLLGIVIATDHAHCHPPPRRFSPAAAPPSFAMVLAPPDLPVRFPCWCQAVYSWGGEVSIRCDRRRKTID